MKKNSVLFLFCLNVAMLLSKENEKQSYLLKEALSAKKINCIITGNDKSTHYHMPLAIHLENRENTPLEISINNGDVFVPQDAAYQNIIITNEERIVLLPKEKKDVALSGMCIEHSDKSGNNALQYFITENKNDTLKLLAQFIQKNKLQTSSGQYAMWCISDHNDINSVYSADSTEEHKLKSFLAKLTGRTFTVADKNYKNYYFAPPKEKVSGKFNFRFSNMADIQIALFNTRGILVRELYNEKKVPPGEHNFHYAFDASVYTEDIYFVKFIADGEVFINREWNVKAIREKFKQKVQQKLNGN